MEEQLKELDPLTQSVKDLVQERDDLRNQNIELQATKEKLLLRERLYQSELTKTKGALQKLAQGIVTTPHSKSEEYAHYYKEETCQEQ